MRIMRSVITVAAAGLGLWLTAVPAAAHHAFAAEFDINQPVTLKGTITKMEWINPHAWMHLDVKTPEGKVEAWEIELGNPNGLLRRGWTRRDPPAGTEVVVTGYRSKDGSTRANGKDANLPDGRKLFIGSADTGAPDFGK